MAQDSDLLVILAAMVVLEELFDSMSSIKHGCRRFKLWLALYKALNGALDDTIVGKRLSKPIEDLVEVLLEIVLKAIDLPQVALFFEESEVKG